MAGVDVPWSPQRKFDRLDEDDEDTTLDDQEVLSKADEMVEEIQRVAYLSFALNRGESREIHTNSFWDLQTYLGLRENLAANEGARSFTLESSRDRTPLGHTHRSHLRDLSIEEIREMYREAIGRLIN